MQLYLLAEDVRAWHEAEAWRWPEMRQRRGAQFRRWSGQGRAGRSKARALRRRHRLPSAVRRG